MRRQQAESIGNIYRAILKNTWLGPALLRVEVFQTWEATVIPQAAKSTVRQFFKDGILYVTLSSSSLRSHLYFQLEDIRRKMNFSLSASDDEPIHKIILK